jgi:hypothetical protein
LVVKVKEKKMTKKNLWLGILAMVLVFGMTVVGCGEDTPKDEFFAGTLEINNLYPAVGETITATFVPIIDQYNPAPNGTQTWEWYKTQDKGNDTYYSLPSNKTRIGDGSSTYTVKQEDVGYWIWVRLSYTGNNYNHDTRTSSTAMDTPATATVSVSMSAEYFPSSHHRVTVTLTLSDGRWDDVTYGTASQWLTMSGTPSVSTWSGNMGKREGRELVFIYSTSSETALSISNLTAALNTDQLDTMRSNTNVYDTLTAGTPSSVSASQWTTH